MSDSLSWGFIRLPGQSRYVFFSLFIKCLKNTDMVQRQTNIELTQ
jgi:hypothetical protein